MLKLKKLHAVILAAAIVALSVQSSFAYAEGTILKKGMRNEEIATLQSDLKKLGFFDFAATGYFGSITLASVMEFQKQNNLDIDGIAGSQTLGRIDAILKRPQTISRGGTTQRDSRRENKIVNLPWFEKVSRFFAIGDTAKVTDIDTGLSITVKRTYGVNHADVETLTSEDTAVLRKIAGGEWNWTRRAVIVEIDGYRIAGSLTAMPHAGRDDRPANIVVSGLSGGYGTGENLDSIKKNGMDGHFDIHFLNSRTHATNRVDEDHQKMVEKAYESDK